MSPFRTTVAVLSTTALLGGLASPALAQESTGTYPTDQPTQTDTTTKHRKHKKAGRHRNGRSDARLTQVATALGTTLEALKAAQAKVKAAVQATEERETKAEKDALLAEELGVTVTELREAFASARPARGERRGHRHGGGRGGDCQRPVADPSGGDSADYPTGA